MCWIECTRWSSDADPHIPGELRLRIGRKEAIFCNSERLVIWKEFITMKKDNLSEPVPRRVVDPQGVTHGFDVFFGWNKAKSAVEIPLSMKVGLHCKI